MDYYVLEKEEEGSKCGMLDLGKCIDGSNDSTVENVFTATSSGNDSGEGARGGENTSRGSDYHGEETVVESEDHIMQFISGTPEVGSTGFRQNPESQMEKNINECDSATDSMLKEIIDMNVVGVNQTEKVSQSARENKEKMVQPVLDPSSTDEDSSKSLVSSDTPSDPKKTKTLDDILDDFCDENSDTITSQTSSTTDTDDSGSIASKNPLFEVDKGEDDKVERNIQKVATEENKIEDNLQKFVQHEQGISFPKPSEHNKIEEEEEEEEEEKMIEGTVEEEYHMIQESDINSKNMQDLDTQKSRGEEEDIHDDIYDKGENNLKFSSVDPVNNRTSSAELPQRSDCYEESNDWEAEDISKNNKTAIESCNMPLESPKKDDKDHSGKDESGNTNHFPPTPDSENREEMKHHSTHSPLKKRGLKLARHNINTEVIESHSVAGDLTSETSNKRDMADSENIARKKLRPDTDLETKYDERGVNQEHSFHNREFPSETGYDYTHIPSKEKSLAMEDEPMADSNNQMEEARENCDKALESTVIGFEMDPQIIPQSENMDPQIIPQSENMDPQITSQSENEPLNGLHAEDTEDSSHITEDTSNKEAEILKTNNFDQEKTTQSEDSRPINSTKAVKEEDGEIEKQSDTHIEESNSSTKENLDERESHPHIKDTEADAQKQEEKAEIATAPSRYEVSSEDSSSYAPEHAQETTTDDAYADFDEENIENISRTIRSFTNEKLSPKKQDKTTSSDQKEVSPSKKVIMVKTAPNVEKVKRKLEEILEKSKGEEDAAIAELQRMKKEKTDILNAITTEMEKLKSMLLVKGKQG